MARQRELTGYLGLWFLSVSARDASAVLAATAQTRPRSSKPGRWPWNAAPWRLHRRHGRTSCVILPWDSWFVLVGPSSQYRSLNLRYYSPGVKRAPVVRNVATEVRSFADQLAPLTAGPSPTQVSSWPHRRARGVARRTLYLAAFRLGLGVRVRGALLRTCLAIRATRGRHLASSRPRRANRRRLIPTGPHQKMSSNWRFSSTRPRRFRFKRLRSRRRTQC